MLAEIHNDGTVDVKSNAKDGTVRRVKLIPGNQYRVKPLNPQKLKHRDRLCIFRGVIWYGKDNRDATAGVKFLDTQKVGRVEFGDLIEGPSVVEGS